MYTELQDYARLKSFLGRQFNPVERAVAFRCEYTNWKREKQELCSRISLGLSLISIESILHVTYFALDAQIIYNFIHGLGHYKLKKHVQFHNPVTLDQAIAHSMEYEAFDGSHYHVKKL